VIANRNPLEPTVETTNATRTRAGFFKLATFCELSLTWKDGKKAFPTESDAVKSAKKPGQYRVSKVSESGRHDLLPFTV
jgi:hypothetical protein